MNHTNVIANLRSTLIHMPREMAAVAEDAWLYGIIVGWDEALDSVAQNHGWNEETVARLLDLRNQFSRLTLAEERKDNLAIFYEESLNGETLYNCQGVRYIATYTADKKHCPDDISESRQLVGTLRKQGLDNEFPPKEVVAAFNFMLEGSYKGKLVGARFNDSRQVEYDGPSPILNEDEFLIQMEVT